MPQSAAKKLENQMYYAANKATQNATCKAYHRANATVLNQKRRDRYYAKKALIAAARLAAIEPVQPPESEQPTPEVEPTESDAASYNTVWYPPEVYQTNDFTIYAPF